MINLSVLQQTVNYTIYLKNQGSDAQVFWCFLQAPISTGSSTVYANSDTFLQVRPNYGGINKFVIPQQYTLGAGASNQAVGLKIQVESSYMAQVDLNSAWNVDYVTVPPPGGPTITRRQQDVVAGKINVKTNQFDKVRNEQNKWFSNMSFGIETSQGFTGITWSPSPNSVYTIEPKFAFYIATGDYTANELANITTISGSSAPVGDADFLNLETTVTLLADGTWDVTPGR